MSALPSTVPSQAASPVLFFETVQSYQRSFILKAGVDVGLFTSIAKGSHTIPEIAKACSAPERGIRVLCDCLTILGFLSKAGNRYSLTPDSATFLDSRSPAYMGNALKFMLHPRQLERMQQLTETVRRGIPDEDIFAATGDDIWVDFARGMAPLMYPAAQAIAQLLQSSLAGKNSAKVLDIAAGHGTFGVSVAEHLPNAQIYALDWANVLQVARENAAAHGVGSRYHLLEGSAFDVDWGTGYDAVLLTNFLHHFSPATNIELLKKVHKALNPGGQVVILEFVPNDDRVSPSIPAMFSLVMLSGTREGDAYTFTQLSEMCRNAGLQDAKLVQLSESPESLVVARKPA